ncbi:MAG: hypothetical protein QF733_08130 [Phycisphaerales bacterium]|jgi:hypothetical protein|nr:hypothetical protein [Phycisphaerales bacterium]
MPRWVVFVSLSILAWGSWAVASWGSPRDAAVHHELDLAISPQPGNGHLMRLSALRALRDPRLEPLLVSLLGVDDSATQIHALLGLAELDPDGVLTPDRLKAAEPEAAEIAIQLAIADDRVRASDLRALLERAHTPEARLAIFAGLLRASEPVAPAELAAVDVEPETPAEATLAALQAHLGRPASMEALAVRLRATPDAELTQATVFAALEQARRFPSEAATRLAWACLKTETSPGLRRFALLTLLEANAPGAGDAFATEYRAATRRRHQVDLALLLLMTETDPPDAIRPLMDQDDLLAPMADAASALAAGPGTAGPALERLIDAGHRRTITWAVDASEDWPEELAPRLLDRVIDQAVEAGLQSPMSASGVAAAQALLERAPDRFRERLATAEDDGTEQQLLLLALLQAPAPELAGTVAAIHRIGIAAPDTLALLVLARDGATLDPSDVSNLQLIATGSQASEAVRTQAAWLAVRHSGVVDDVVASLLRPAH